MKKVTVKALRAHDGRKVGQVFQMSTTCLKALEVLGYVQKVAAPAQEKPKPKPEPVQDGTLEQEPKRRTYKRRDMQAE